MKVCNLEVFVTIPPNGTNVYNWALYCSDDGTVHDLPPQSLNKRSRGRHEPGSGKYTNRWVFSHSGPDVIYPGGRLPTSYSDSGGGWPEGTSNSEWVVRCGVAGDYTLYQLYAAQVHDPNNAYFCVQAHGWKIPERILDWPTARKYRKRIGVKRISVNYFFAFKDYGGKDGAREAAQEKYHLLQLQGELSYDACPWPDSGAYIYYIPSFTLSPDATPRFSLLPEKYDDQVDLGIDAGAGMQAMIANAYVDAVSRLPDMAQMGNAVNALQLVSSGVNLLRGLLGHRVGATVGSLSDAWLAYRYSYCTTKSDLMEVSSYLSRAADLLFVDSVRSNGVFTHTTSNGDRWVARCSISMGESALSSLKSTIERYGLQLDGYAMWDLVPYSFVADWLLDVGGRLEYARKVNFARRIKGPLCWVSIERRFTNEFGFEEIYYHRRQFQPNASLATYVRHMPGKVTIVKRALDVLALLPK